MKHDASKIDAEMIEIVDENDQVLSVTTRKKADEMNAITRNVIVFAFHDNRVVMQMRSLDKKHYPGLYDVSAAGALNPAESPLEAAKRELEEEIGIVCDLKYVTKFYNQMPDESATLIRKRWSYLFVGELLSHTPTSHNHEVEHTKWENISKLLGLLDKSPELFVPTFDIELRLALYFRKVLS